VNFPGPAQRAEHAKSVDLLLGRHTCDIWAGFWPKVPSNPLADSLNAATKYVATHRPDSLEWGPVESLGQDIVEDVRHIKVKSGPDLILWGSSTLTPMLLEHGLADEVLLFVYPVLLGKGKRFFSDGTPPRELALTSTKAASSGVIISTYTPAGPLRAGQAVGQNWTGRSSRRRTRPCGKARRPTVLEPICGRCPGWRR
jgi:dihydrofolate reductase